MIGAAREAANLLTPPTDDTPPPPPPTFVVFCVLDVHETPPRLVAVKDTRHEARAFVEWSQDPTPLRIRRGRLIISKK